MTNTNRDVAIAWVKGRSARSANGNFWTNGACLFSYNTPIAKIVDVRGKMVALITERHYSPTTEGKHVNAAFRAMGYVDCFRVPYILADGGWAQSCVDRRTGYRYADRDMHEANLIYLAGLVGAENERLKRARVYTDRAQLERLTRQAETYRDTFLPDMSERIAQAA